MVWILDGTLSEHVNLRLTSTTYGRRGIVALPLLHGSLLFFGNGRRHCCFRPGVSTEGELERENGRGFALPFITLQRSAEESIMLGVLDRGRIRIHGAHDLAVCLEG